MGGEAAPALARRHGRQQAGPAALPCKRSCRAAAASAGRGALAQAGRGRSFTQAGRGARAGRGGRLLTQAGVALPRALGGRLPVPIALVVRVVQAAGQGPERALGHAGDVLVLALRAVGEGGCDQGVLPPTCRPPVGKLAMRLSSHCAWWGRVGVRAGAQRQAGRAHWVRVLGCGVGGQRAGAVMLAAGVRVHRHTASRLAPPMGVAPSPHPCAQPRAPSAPRPIPQPSPRELSRSPSRRSAQAPGSTRWRSRSRRRPWCSRGPP